jgi:hypothetical protein
MNPLIFYTRPGCHLCEDGEWIVEVALKGQSQPLELINIETAPHLEAQYGQRIPVLYHPQLPTELNWPFTPESILAWLAPVL